ncbi:type VI secretion system tip protein VgrG [Siccibacter turicensis]|uniref:type VI secretion system tip protein VgrG n=1 Tax=Siccibacter turicensis TaxID=357233 RepID=UPI002A6B8115|nr:type VI secretion system tip protein VgrG [Siccibacter turicensis]MDY0972750.1 type VI secretion system tip protein VgrG [Siccibacter turicensis]
MDNWSALFDGQTRYFLEINDSSVKPDVLRFRGREALSEPFSWDIEFTTLQANIPPEEVLMKYATFRMRSGKSVHGMVTRLEWLSSSKDQSHYRLTLSSRLALLGYTRQCAVFQNQSVPEVVEQVLRKHGLEGPDFDFRLERTYPPREIITQWRETDLQFIRRILSEVGIYWRTMMDDVRGLDTYILADSQLNYQFDVRLPYSEPSGLFDGAAESVWDVRTWHNIAPGTVAARDYNYRRASTPMNAAVSVRNDAVTTGAHYRYAAPYRVAGDDASPEPETESGAFYARLHHERELNRSARIHLFSNAAHLTPGQVLEAQGNVITALQEGVILTLVTFRGARDSRLHVSVWGQPYTERYCFRPVEVPRPVIPGTLPARIESREKNDIYAHLDEQGRYRVKPDFDREGTEPPEAVSLPPPATMREFNPETLTPWVTPVYAKSCLKEKGCTDAGTAEEPVDNFGQMTIFAQPVEDDCCGYGHEHANDEVVQHAQSAKKRKPDAGGANAPAPAQATAAPLALGAATGVMTQVWGEWSLTGVLGAARGIPYVGPMLSVLYVPSAGEGSDRVPGRDEFWYEEELRQKAITGAKATTRVRFFWRQDEKGNMRVYGVHTGEGTPYEGVRTANMVWNSEHNRYEFTPAHGADGPLITWTPERPEGSDLPSHTGSDIRPIDQATILVTPIPDGKDEYTTPPFPVPEERDLNDYILVFPADSGIKTIYVYLKTARDEPGVATGKGEALSGSEKWLEAASSGLGAPVPAQVADKLRGKPFRNFDHFRAEFWLAVSECPELLSQFNKSNQMIIKKWWRPICYRGTNSRWKGII